MDKNKLQELEFKLNPKTNGFFLFKEEAGRTLGSMGGFGDAGLEAEDNISEGVNSGNTINNQTEVNEVSPYEESDWLISESVRDEKQKIKEWLKTTTEPYDEWHWDGLDLTILNEHKVVEIISRKILSENNIVPEKLEPSSSPRNKYGCLMSYFDIPLWNDVISIIDPEDVYDNENGDFGIEKEPHTTILFGFHDQETNLDDIKKELGDITEVPISIKGISHFNGSDSNKPYDVIKFDIDSPVLHKLNGIMKKFPNTNEYPEYHPHMTIGYVKAGAGEKYDGKLIKQPNIISKKIVYSHPSGKKDIWELPIQSDVYNSKEEMADQSEVNEGLNLPKKNSHPTHRCMEADIQDGQIFAEKNDLGYWDDVDDIMTVLKGANEGMQISYLSKEEMIRHWMPIVSLHEGLNLQKKEFKIPRTISESDLQWSGDINGTKVKIYHDEGDYAVFTPQGFHGWLDLGFTNSEIDLIIQREPRAYPQLYMKEGLNLIKKQKKREPITEIYSLVYKDEYVSQGNKDIMDWITDNGPNVELEDVTVEYFDLNGKKVGGDLSYFTDTYFKVDDFYMYMFDDGSTATPQAYEILGIRSLPLLSTNQYIDNIDMMEDLIKNVNEDIFVGVKESGEIKDYPIEEMWGPATIVLLNGVYYQFYEDGNVWPANVDPRPSNQINEGLNLQKKPKRVREFTSIIGLVLGEEGINNPFQITEYIENIDEFDPNGIGVEYIDLDNTKKFGKLSDFLEIYFYIGNYIYFLTDDVKIFNVDLYDILEIGVRSQPSDTLSATNNENIEDIFRVFKNDDVANIRVIRHGESTARAVTLSTQFFYDVDKVVYLSGDPYKISDPSVIEELPVRPKTANTEIQEDDIHGMHDGTSEMSLDRFMTAE